MHPAGAGSDILGALSAGKELDACIRATGANAIVLVTFLKLFRPIGGRTLKHAVLVITSTEGGIVAVDMDPSGKARWIELPAG